MKLGGKKFLPSGVPSCLNKRRLLNEKALSPALCRGYAEKFAALGWWEDALEFSQRGQDAPGLEKVKNHALETGDAYLLGRLGRQQDPQLWRMVAERALELGKLHYARRAFELAGDLEKSTAVSRLMEGELPEA